MKFKLILLALLLVFSTVVGCSAQVSVADGQSSNLSQVTRLTEYIFIEKPVEVVREVEVIKELPPRTEYIQILPVKQEVRPFVSRDELVSWLESYEIVIITWGTIKLNSIDCEDYAFSMVYGAIRDGYLLGTEILDRGNKSHMVVIAFVPAENAIYYIEPQSKELLSESRRMD